MSTTVISGYDYFGGIHPETATVANYLRFLGVTDPATGKPFSEAMLFGIAGGLGRVLYPLGIQGVQPSGHRVWLPASVLIIQCVMSRNSVNGLASRRSFMRPVV